jgi:hypothetical protein
VATTKAEAPELKPCPFCPDGGKPYFTRTVNGTKMLYVGCSQCGVSMKAALIMVTPVDEQPSKDLVAIWNTRASLAETRFCSADDCPCHALNLSQLKIVVANHCADLAPAGERNEEEWVKQNPEAQLESVAGELVSREAAITARERWLLHDASSLGRQTIQTEQYDELRALARRLAALPPVVPCDTQSTQQGKAGFFRCLLSFGHAGEHQYEVARVPVVAAKLSSTEGWLAERGFSDSRVYSNTEIAELLAEYVRDLVSRMAHCGSVTPTQKDSD